MAERPSGGRYPNRTGGKLKDSIRRTSPSSGNGSVGRWVVFAALAPGLFGTMADESGVNQALPRIAEHFDATIPEVQWVVLAYILTIGALMIPLGRLADMVGRRRIYLLGAAVFAIGALAAGSAPGLLPLVGLKVVQGVGAAMIHATGMAILTSAFPPRERGKAVGLFMLVGGAGGIFGPLVGGSVLSWLGWRWMVYMGVPFGLLSLVAGLVLMRGLVEERPSAGEPFDWLGAGLSSAGIVVFLLVMSNGNNWGWTSLTTLAGLIGSAIFVTGFVLWQRRARFPMLPSDILASPLFTRGLALTFLIILGNVPVFLLMPFYLQDVQGRSPAVAGMVLAIAAAAFTVVGPVAGYFSDRFDWRIFVTASTLLIATTLALLSMLGENSSLAQVMGLMLMLGVGVGLWYSPTTAAALSEVDRRRFGVASSATHMARYAASLSTVAIAFSVVAAIMASRGFEPSLSSVSEATADGASRAFVDGMSLVFRIGAAVNLLAAVVTLVPFGRKGRKHPNSSPNPEADVI